MEQQLEKKKFKFVLNEKVLEIVIAIFMSLTAVCTAWSSWVSGLHGSNQDQSYATANSLQTEGNSEWNEATQMLIQDMLLWNNISELQVAYNYYDDDSEGEKTLTAYKLYNLCCENLSDTMAAAIGWDDAKASKANDEAGEIIKNNKEATKEEIYAPYVAYIDEWLQNEKATTTPFSKEDYIESYYTDASAVLKEAATALENGNKDNANSDKYALCSVFFSLVLFLLGIAGMFKQIPNRTIIVGVAILIFILSTVYMIWVPLPRGFALVNYFIK